MTQVTEFEILDPEEMHLVGEPANGFSAPLLAKAAEALEAQLCYSEDGTIKYVSAAMRRKYAKNGVAMPNGDFPIPDEGHLRSAIGRLGNYKGDKAKAKAHIIARAKALHLVHLLPKEWHVKKDIAPERDFSVEGSEGQTHEVNDDETGADPEAHDGGSPPTITFRHPPVGDGGGDTAPDKALPMTEAMSQTRSEKDAVNMTGATVADNPFPHQEDPLAAEHESVEPTGLPAPGLGVPPQAEAHAYSRKDSADTDPGSPAWEHKDVALGEEAEALIARLAEVVRTFTEREKAEGRSTKQGRRAVAWVKRVAKDPRLQKEMLHMSTNELMAALNEHDAARRAEKKAAKAAKKAKERKVKEAKAAKKAAKASKESARLEKRLKKTEKVVQKMAAQPAKYPFVNGAGVTAALRGSDKTRTRVFAELEEQVAQAEKALETAPSEGKRLRAQADLAMARKRLATAKLIANENARARGERPPSRFGPNSTQLFDNVSVQLEDPDLRYV
jgi:murein DD-endopeptidase MepM/ murein hydrolase activator NlpD